MKKKKIFVLVWSGGQPSHLNNIINRPNTVTVGENLIIIWTRTL